MGGLFKVVGWLMGVFLIAAFACGFLYVVVYTILFKLAGC